MANVPQDKRVLSVQSHVVSGFVGNKAATFPLQLLGWEVDQANTVEFSNHTGSRYGRWGGSKFDAAHLEDIFSALDANGLFRQSHLLTGYVPGATALQVVAKTVDRLRQINRDLVYILDPVMGDDGRIYVSEQVIPIYKSLIRKATCATPNYFEAELLTSITINTAASLLLALKSFHTTYALPHIVISAVSLPSHELAKLGVIPSPSPYAPGQKLLLCAGSSIVSAPGEEVRSVAFGIVFEELDEHYEGVGDVFSSLVLARFPPLDILALATSPANSSPSSTTTTFPNHPPRPPNNPWSLHPISPLAHTAELAIASLQGILQHTRENALRLAKGRASELVAPKEVEGVSGGGEGTEERVRRLRRVELRLVQSQEEILRPVVTRRAVRIA